LARVPPLWWGESRLAGDRFASSIQSRAQFGAHPHRGQSGISCSLSRHALAQALLFLSTTSVIKQPFVQQRLRDVHATRVRARS
jgi:hypothetical protein